MKLSRRLYEGQCGGSSRCRGRCRVPHSGGESITSTDKTAITWDKAPCRFCGTGCSVLVGSQANRVRGDPGGIPMHRSTVA